jgi:hypothetical protein
MPVAARRLVRKMRGGAQAHLIEAADGHCYVVKFVNNPQHRRILVNDWLGTAFLRYLGLSAPEPALVQFTTEFIADHPDLHIQLGQRRSPPESGWHFGSRFPGDPVRTVVYDYLPDVLLQGVANRAEFAGTLAFDQWTGNADSRQAIFFRAHVKELAAGVGGGGKGSGGGIQQEPKKQFFVAQMIDHGFLFDGPHWRFGDSPIRGLYHRPLIYGGVKRICDFEPWLDRIVHFPEEVIDQTVKQIPPEWIAGEEDALYKLMEQLLRRRKRVPDLIAACRAGRADVFPDWKES